MPIAPPALAAIPDFPLLADRATYNSKAYNWALAMQGGFAPGVVALAANAYANALEADADAIATMGYRNEAAASAGTASDKAGQALASAGAAAASEAVIVALGKRYLGSKAANPVLDNEGAALQSGAVYYNSVLGKVLVYTGAAWVEGIASVAGVTSYNGQTGAVVVAPIPEIVPPVNVTPANAVVILSSRPTFIGTAFYSLYGATNTAIQLQISTSADFTAPAYSSGDQTPGGTFLAPSFKIPDATLAVSTAYQWRIRYKDSRGTYSDWSTPFAFTTASTLGDFIPTPTATPAAIGDAFEGGFYTGMIWNEVGQSSTSMLIGTGSKTFTVPDMEVTPIAYSGQTVEVRSRANPANKFIGTVTGAVGASLTINVTSVGGSGTFSDWSIMSRFRVIVAPKASGEVNRTLKSTDTALPTDTFTATEGRRATLAMVAAGDSTVYPAAHFCNSLNIGGRTDWFLPSRDEFELVMRNLKSGTNTNSVASRGLATTSYTTRGSYGDPAADTVGVNRNSSPTGAAYTSTVPAQVAAGKNFRTAESEVLTVDAGYHVSSEADQTGTAWYFFLGSTAGQWGTAFIGGLNKTSLGRIRAVRRSII